MKNEIVAFMQVMTLLAMRIFGFLTLLSMPAISYIIAGITLMQVYKAS